MASPSRPKVTDDGDNTLGNLALVHLEIACQVLEVFAGSSIKAVNLNWGLAFFA